jgi:hypothetical protein
VELTANGAALLSCAGIVFDEELERLISGPLSPTTRTHWSSAPRTVRSAADRDADTKAAARPDCE